MRLVGSLDIFKGLPALVLIVKQEGASHVGWLRLKTMFGME